MSGGSTVRPSIRCAFAITTGQLAVQGLYYARQSRPNEAVPGPPEGCALLTRSKRLTLLASKTVR